MLAAELSTLSVTQVVLVLKVCRRHGALALCGGLDPLTSIPEKLLEKVQSSHSRRPQHFGDTSITGWSPRIAAAVHWSLSLGNKLCVLQRVELEK